MERKPSLESSLRKSLQKKREEIALTDFQLTTARSLSPGQLLPLVIEPAIAGVNLASWAGNNKDYLVFNQIQLHHISCLDPDVWASLLSMFRKEDVPRNVYYGDGTHIEDAVIAEISALYEQQAVRFQWQVGDVIVIDNMLVAHARDPFEGTRKVLVAMAEVVLQQDLAGRR